MLLQLELPHHLSMLLSHLIQLLRPRVFAPLKTLLPLPQLRLESSDSLVQGDYLRVHLLDSFSFSLKQLLGL